MAKITRKAQKVFAVSAGGTGITEFGSPASGTPAYSTDPDAIQTTEWEGGWEDAALAGGEIPTFQDFNAMGFVLSRQIAYLFQEGIPEYNSATEYHQNSIVKKTGTYELYGSKINTNTGNALPSAVDDSNWEYLGNLSNLSANSLNDLLYVREEQASGTDGGNITIDTWTSRVLNTVVQNNISGASLSSNTVTLPAGTYIFEANGPAFRSGTVNPTYHKVRLRNVTDTTYNYGTTEVIQYGITRSKIFAYVTIASPKDFDLQHYFTNNVEGSNKALGQANGIPSVNEVYSEMKIWKVL